MFKMVKFFDRYIYSDELPLEIRITNTVYVIGFFSSLLLLLSYLFLGTNKSLIPVILAINFSIAALFFLANRFSLHRAGRWITIIVICFILFPLAFFPLGGVNSTIPTYFVLSIVLIFLFSAGKIRFFLLCAHIAEAVACYYVSSRPFFSRFIADAAFQNRYLDSIFAFIVIGLCIGFIVDYQRQLNEKERIKSERVRDDLFYQGKLLRMVNHVAEQFLYTESENPEENFVAAMEMMAHCIDADRMYLWQNRMINGKLHYVQEYEWVSPGIEPTLKVKTGFSYLDLPVWEARLALGQAINGPINSLSPEERRTLFPFGIESILIIPIILQEKFWGFASFDNCHSEEAYSEETVAMLRSGCLLIANAAVRKKNQLMIKTRLEQQELMADISQSFISSESMAVLIQDALGRIGEFLGINRILVVMAEKDTDESFPVYAWFGEEKWKQKGVQMGFNRLINSLFPKKISGKEKIFPHLCDDIYNDEGGKFSVLARAGLKSFIWAPVYVKGSYWGLVTVESCDRFREWSESDAQLVGSVSSAIAGAVARDLMEKERSAALEQALQASMAKGNFLSNMSHEMRTPMNAIIGMTAIGLGAKDIQKKDYAFSKIDDASTHLLGVINDILDMSKIEANKLELSPVSFNFEKMLQKVVNIINFRVEERNQSFYVTIDKQIPRLLIGDDQRLSQVITNLLSNAVKFTPEGGTIRVNAQNMEDGEDYCRIRIEVADTGIGISKEQQERLFNSFEQAESNTTRKYGGTGLGLAISKRIVEMMNGKIWINSEVGKGSAFIFTALLKKDLSEHRQLLNPGVNWSNIRILAVDDDVEVLKCFAGIAERFGIKCDTAGSADEAISLIDKKGTYDIYFIDWKMPGMDGLELSGKIKEKGARSVITMISAIAFSDMEAEAKEAGVDKFLSKPIFPSDIADWINTCLGVPGADSIQERKGGDQFEENCILLVEDVEINQEIVLALLEPTGLAIDCAKNGIEAVRLYTENPGKYGMIFMDIQMPEMDGYEATRKIREAERAKDRRPIPIVAMTANVFREDIEKSLAAGMNDHVGKPLDFNEVITKLRKYLSKTNGDKGKLIRYGEGGSGVSEKWKYGIAWSPALTTGNKEIDSQHKQIFRLTSNLSAACSSGQGFGMLNETLEFLASYTVRHFSDEEDLQLKYHFPGYEEHKKLHDDFKKTVSDLVEDFKKNGSSGELLEKVSSTIVHWLVEHIEKEDSKIADYIKQHGDEPA
jgi:hemerythrin-like metal-binding protein